MSAAEPRPRRPRPRTAGNQPALSYAGYAPPWVEVVPIACCCRWRNTSDEGGWTLVHRASYCPLHGNRSEA